MKRMMALLTVALIVLTVLPTGVLAEDLPVIQGDQVAVKPGCTVEYSVSLSDNPGLTAYMVYVSCDTNVFSIEYDEDAQSYTAERGDAYQNGSILCSKDGNRGWKISWFASQAVSTDGDLFHLQITAASEANPGTYPVTITYSARNTLDSDYSAVTLFCIDGSITVAPETGAFRITDTSATPGGDFDLCVVLDANPGIAAFKLYIDCDPSLFVADYIDESRECRVATGTVTQGGSLICTQNGDRGYQVIWQTTQEVLKTGTAFTLPLHVAETVESGDYAITLRIDTKNLIDQTGSAVTATATNGLVHVRDCLIYDLEIVDSSIHYRLEVGSGRTVNVIYALYSKEGRILKVEMTQEQGPCTEKCGSSIPKNMEYDHIKIFAVDAATFEPLLASVTP